MPNWCDCTYRIDADKTIRQTIADAFNKRHAKQTEIRDAYYKERDILLGKGYEHGQAAHILETRGIKWTSSEVSLFGLLIELGYSEEEINRMGGNKRGTIYNMENSDAEGRLTLNCNTAWGEADGFRGALNDKFNPNGETDFNILYVAVESGCEVYVTNDPDYEGMYYVDIENNDCTIENAVDTKKIIEEHLGRTFDTLEEALTAADEFDEDDNHIWIHVFEMSEY